MNPKKVMMLIIILLLIPNAMAEIFFEQVLYDPLGTESGGEAIQIYNNGTKAVNLKDFVIETESSLRDVVFKDERIFAKNYFLISDLGWNEKKDNLSWKSSDLENTITMKNSNSYIKLINPNGTVLDFLCWGVRNDSKNCGQIVTPGNSLLRQFYTGNNSFDYVEEKAEFPSFEIKTSKTLQLTLNISADIFSINDILIKIPDDDIIKSGTQINPDPGKVKKVNISLSHNASVKFNEENLFVRAENATYIAEMNLDYSMPAGIYELELNLKNETRIISFEYLSLSALTLDVDTIEMNQLKLEGDYNFESKEFPTIKNVGNTELKIGIKATDFYSSKNLISVADIYFKIGQEEKQARRIIDVFSPILDIAETIPFGIDFRIGSVQKGQYKGDITILGVAP